MGDELKPCPFCGEGGCVVVPRFVDDVVAAKRVECPCCLAFGPECPTEERAVRAWNTRTETQSQATIDELVGAVRSAAELVEWICERAAKIDHARYLEKEGGTGKVDPEIDVLANAQFNGMLASYRDEFDTILSRHKGEGQ